MKKIYLKKSVMMNLELDNAAIGTYIVLRSLYLLECPVTYISINQLCYLLCGNLSYTRYTKEKILWGLKQLEKEGLVKVVEEISKSEFILDLSGLHINSQKGTEEYYLIITSCEVNTIFNINRRVDKFALVRFFAIVIGSINYTATIKDIRREYSDTNNFVGFMPLSYLSGAAGLAESTAISYFEVLEDIKLLYVFRHMEYKWDEKNNKISSFVNKYGRYENKELIKCYAETYENYTNVYTVSKMKKKKDGNRRRSLTQKYHALCRGKQYTQKEMMEIYDFIQERNKEILEKIAEIKSGNHSSNLLNSLEEKLFDETVFEKISVTCKTA